jgi:hypothetical protein
MIKKFLSSLVIISAILIYVISIKKFKKQSGSYSKSISTSTAMKNYVDSELYVNAKANANQIATANATADIGNNKIIANEGIDAVADASNEKLSSVEISQLSNKTFSESSNNKYKTFSTKDDILQNADYYQDYNNNLSDNKTQTDYAIDTDKQITSKTSKVIVNQDDQSILVYNNKSIGDDYVVMDSDYDLNITLEFNYENKKLIVQKIMGDDEPPIIISASKNLINILSEDNKKLLKKFYEEKCNCFNLRKFIVRLLST